MDNLAPPSKRGGVCMGNTSTYVVNPTLDQRLVSLFKSVATCCDGIKSKPNDIIIMPKVPFLTKNSR